MVKLLIGRAGTGKSDALLRTMAARAADRKQILIVPEQYSHQAERRLCAVGGNTVSMGAEVLTFTRLASRVFASAGGLAAPELDGGGRCLAMYLALREAASGLNIYKKPDRQGALLKGLIATLDECKSYRVSPRDLFAAGEAVGGATGDKLGDLGLIFNTYEALCATLGADPRDRLTRLAEGLKKSRWCAGMDVYLDGFTDFTPQEGLVLAAMMKDAHSVTVALTCDHVEETDEGLGIFSPARRTAAYLLRLAQEAGTDTEVEKRVEFRPGKAEAITHIERELFADRPETFGGPAPVRRAAARDPREEVEWVCAEILRLVREEGYRFRDIAVTAREMEPYEELARSVFARYGLPLFLTRSEDILEKPVMTLITAALDAVSGGYRYEDMFRWLKTGLSDLTVDQVDRLENYVLTWDIRGSKWYTEKAWHMHPGGYGQTFRAADEEEVQALDALRRQVIAPLEKLRTRKAETGRDWAMGLYEFLEDIDLPGALTRRVTTLRERGELTLAEEYAQLWDILTAALEQCAQVLREEKMDLEEWSGLFPLILSQYQVAAIPVALDRVTAGDCTRLGYQTYKAVFFLGCDDRHVPLCAPAPGLLTDADRAAMGEAGFAMAPRMEDKLHREMTICYNVCTLPTQRLYLLYAAGVEGEERRPSFLMQRMGLLFPDMPLERAGDTEPRLAAPEPALELAAGRPALSKALKDAGWGDRVDRLERAMKVDRGRLSPAGVSALYGRRVPMSASRMDLYKSCHFAYFMRYGLAAKPRKAAGFDAPEYGTFVHAVLEEVLGKWKKDMTPEEVKGLTQAAMKRYLEEDLGGLEDKTPRFAYLFRRLRRTVERVVENVTEEMARSEFRPLAFEMRFGAGGDLPPVELKLDDLTVSLTGVVDRVDGWEHDGRLYLRVVDYKTGRKSFDLTDIFNGMGLQMLLYLFTLEDKGAAVFGKEIVPAGVLYLPAQDPVVDGERDMPEDKRRAKLDSDLVRKGLLLGDPAVLNAMEAAPDGGKRRFLPVKVNKEGAFSGDSLASLEQLGKLSAYVKQLLEEVGRELAAGTVAADPYWRGPDVNACKWCEYKAACQFQEGKGGDCRRRQSAMKAEEFWAALEGGDRDGLPSDG